MGKEVPAQNDAFLNEDGDELARARLVQAMRKDAKLRDSVMSQHLVHGLLNANVDRKNGESARRTANALEQLTRSETKSAFPWLKAASVALVLGGLGVAFALAWPTSDAGNDGSGLQAKDNPEGPIHSTQKADGFYGVVGDDSPNLQKRDLDAGREYKNLAEAPLTLFFEQGGSLTLDRGASIVVSVAGAQLSNLDGRIGIEAKSTRLSVMDLESIIHGGPIVADTQLGTISVFNGEVKDLEDRVLIKSGERYEERAGQSLPFEAGKLPNFLVEGRSEEVFSLLKSKVEERFELDASLWMPALSHLLAKPIGREVAKASVESILMLDLKNEEFTDVVEFAQVGLSYFEDTGTTEERLDFIVLMMKRFREMRPAEREADIAKARKNLESWRAMKPEQREFFRKMLIQKYKKD